MKERKKKERQGKKGAHEMAKVKACGVKAENLRFRSSSPHGRRRSDIASCLLTSISVLWQACENTRKKRKELFKKFLKRGKEERDIVAQIGNPSIQEVKGRRITGSLRLH